MKVGNKFAKEKKAEELWSYNIHLLDHCRTTG